MLQPMHFFHLLLSLWESQPCCILLGYPTEQQVGPIFQQSLLENRTRHWGEREVLISPERAVGYFKVPGETIGRGEVLYIRKYTQGQLTSPSYSGKPFLVLLAEGSVGKVLRAFLDKGHLCNHGYSSVSHSTSAVQVVWKC